MCFWATVENYNIFSVNYIPMYIVTVSINPFYVISGLIHFVTAFLWVCVYICLYQVPKQFLQLVYKYLHMFYQHQVTKTNNDNDAYTYCTLKNCVLITTYNIKTKIMQYRQEPINDIKMYNDDFYSWHLRINCNKRNFDGLA